MEGAGDGGILQYFKKGAAIEIKSDDDGFRGSWYEGNVLRAPRDLSSTVLVKYKTLTADEEGMWPLRELLNLVQLRPPPPWEYHSAFELNDEVDAYHNDGWWEGEITQTFEGEDKYLVYFLPWKEHLPFAASQLRLHREWVKEKWVPPLQNKTPLPSKAEANKAVINHNFNKGDHVEASSDEDGFQGAWFPAIFLEKKEAGKYLIDCPQLVSNDETGLLEEEVDGLHLRPRPPDDGLPGRLGYSEKVDAFCNDGWWEGMITQTLEDANKYQVSFHRTGEQLSFNAWQLRPHREWVKERWVPPLDPSSSSYNANQLSPEAEAVSEHNFNPGDHVEARSDEDGFHGAWFPATVLEKTEAEKYLIEYEKLMNDDGSLLREETDELHLRPSPPDVGVTDRFQVDEKVDALYNDCWWVGTITKVHRRERYSVYFEKLPKESKFDHSELRVHQEWINGEWHIAAKDPKSS